MDLLAADLLVTVGTGQVDIEQEDIEQVDIEQVDIEQEDIGQEVDIEEVDIEVVDTVLLMVHFLYQEDELLSVVQPCCTSQVGLPILSGYQIGVHWIFYSSKSKEIPV